jgi:hypothetical protein
MWNYPPAAGSFGLFRTPKGDSSMSRWETEEGQGGGEEGGGGQEGGGWEGGQSGDDSGAGSGDVDPGGGGESS